MNTSSVTSVHVLSSLLARPISASDIRALSLAPSTHKQYNNTLKDYLISTEILPLPRWSPVRIDHYINVLLSRPSWKKASSFVTRIRCLSAIARREGTPIAERPDIVDLIKGFKKIGMFQDISRTFPASLNMTMAAIKLAQQRKRPDVAACLALMWLLALRAEDALRVVLTEITATGPHSVDLMLRWQKVQGNLHSNKTVKRNAPLGQVFLSYAITACSPDRLLFPFRGGTLLKCLKEVDQRLSLHSIRRGALQFLNDTHQLSDKHLLELSGHASLEELYKYLGRSSADRRRRLLEAQDLLSPQGDFVPALV